MLNKFGGIYLPQDSNTGQAVVNTAMHLSVQYQFSE
jgi:hypothetical protein